MASKEQSASGGRLSIHVPPLPSSDRGILRVKGTNIVDKAGVPVILKGAGLGGHLNMENCGFLQ